MPQKGKKSMRGEGDLYSTPKKRYNLMLTEEAKRALDQKASEEGLSTSEFVERIARNRMGEAIA